MATMTTPLQTFLSWAQENGVMSNIKVQKIPDKGWGFVSKGQAARDNSIVAYIPFHLLLNTTKVGKYAKEKAPKLEETFQALLKNGVSLTERIVLICFLLYERFGRSACGEEPSFWKPYVDILPHTLHTPLFYDNTLRACLDGTSLKSAVDAKSNKLRREYNTLRPYFNQWSAQPSTTDNNVNDGHDIITFDHFIWGDGVFWSRVLSFGSRIASDSNLVGIDPDDYHLVPFLDFANHSLRPYARWELTNEGVELILTKSDSPEPILPDTEICISYGDKPNSELLFIHGFTLNDNPWSAISFPVPFYENDEFEEEKFIFMQYHGIKPLVSLTRKKGGAELTHESTRAMWISVLKKEDGLKFTNVTNESNESNESNNESQPVNLMIGDKIIRTLDELDNAINEPPLSQEIERRVINSILENVEHLLSHLKQTNEQVLKMMESGKNLRELEYIKIYREDEYKFLEYAVDDFTRKRESLMPDEYIME
ncbi:SET domain-containing protein [Gigaspora margarita]|uniref:SET domain-containing protein n=2 Tax=Gigaspora margarita TaxID=4874 RepID=A0A8H4AAJ9_GIGMA|nr:SET domain-containing protein [Gigaspora margarita]